MFYFLEIESFNQFITVLNLHYSYSGSASIPPLLLFRVKTFSRYIDDAGCLGIAVVLIFALALVLRGRGVAKSLSRER